MVSSTAASRGVYSKKARLRANAWTVGSLELSGQIIRTADCHSVCGWAVVVGRLATLFHATLFGLVGLMRILEPNLVRAHLIEVSCQPMFIG